MSDLSDSSDGFEIVDIINKPNLVDEEDIKKGDFNKLHNITKTEPINNPFDLNNNNIHNEDSIVLLPKRKNLEIETKVVNKKRKTANDEAKNEVVLLLSSSCSEDDSGKHISLSKSSNNMSELMIVEENIKTNGISKKDVNKELDNFFNGSDSFDDDLTSKVNIVIAKHNSNQAEKKLFINSNDENETDNINGNKSFNVDEIKESSEKLDTCFQTVDKPQILDKDGSSFNSALVNKGNQKNDIILLNITSSEDEDNNEAPIAETSFVFENNNHNNSISLRAFNVASDDDDDLNDIKSIHTSSIDPITSDWKIKQHHKYLATISLTNADLERQLKALNANKTTRQKYSFANKVNKSFKTDIVFQELLLTTDMDLPLKNDDSSTFYLSNIDLMIKKRDISMLKPDIVNLKNNIEGLKVATFTRRLTSVFEINSSIFLPISLLLENGNCYNKTQKLDFVDVDMVECILLLDSQKFYEIFHFKKFEKEKKLLENFFTENKRILIVLTNTSKFISNLNKWENMKQMDKFNHINNNTVTKKKNSRNRIPAQFENLTATEFQSSILQIQLTYKTHISIQQIETELHFINDWFLNYLKTILKARYSDSKNQQEIQSNNNVTGSYTPFECFLLGLNGVTKNNVEDVADLLGNSFSNMQRCVTGLMYKNDCKGIEKKILHLMDKFLQSKNGNDPI
ncbi:hypothetical protein ACO0SA_003616 [Hanseniaspora valbyensis]